MTIDFEAERTRALIGSAGLRVPDRGGIRTLEVPQRRGRCQVAALHIRVPDQRSATMASDAGRWPDERDARRRLFEKVGSLYDCFGHIGRRVQAAMAGQGASGHDEEPRFWGIRHPGLVAHCKTHACGLHMKPHVLDAHASGLADGLDLNPGMEYAGHGAFPCCPKAHLTARAAILYPLSEEWGRVLI